MKAGKPYSIPQVIISIQRAEPKFHFITPRIENKPAEIFELFKNALSKLSDEFVSLPHGFDGMKHMKFPDKAHFCFFMRSEGGKLITVVCLYGVFLHTFEFANWDEVLDTYKFPGFLGLICDWRREREYTIDEWINTLVKTMTQECGM